MHEDVSAIDELRKLVAKFVQQRAPISRSLELMESPEVYDGDVWRTMCDELQLPALCIPEEYGGSGFGLREVGAVLEEMGRVVYPGPFFATAALATQALLLARDESAASRFLPQIAAGQKTATVALFEPDSGWSTRCGTKATRGPDGWRITGTKAWVIDGASADLVLITAACDEGTGLFAVSQDDPNLVSSPVSVLDLTRPMATVRVEAAQATRIGTGDASDWLLPTLIRHAVAAMACEQAGGAQECLSMTLQYLRERIQFGRPIGSFQALRHRCADLFTLTERARATARHAVTVADGDDAVFAAGVAKSFCSDSYVSVADAAVQLHGGIGFTWEYPLHLHLKRAKSSALMFGDPVMHRNAIASLLLAAHRPTNADKP